VGRHLRYLADLRQVDLVADDRQDSSAFGVFELFSYR